jgi:penicillin-binding protein 1A
MMRGVIEKGTGSVVRRLGFSKPAAGKTGTTDNYRDAWFTGFTPNLSVCVWVGFDRGLGMRDLRRKGITGGRGAAPIWADFMIQATAGEPPREFTIPSDIRIEKVNSITGSPAAVWTANPIQVALHSRRPVSKVQEKVTIIEEDLSPQK